MNPSDILKALKNREHDADALNEIIGPVVVKNEFLHQVSGGLAYSSGWICTVSAECAGGISCRIW